MLNCTLGNGKIEFVKEMNRIVKSLLDVSKDIQIDTFKSSLFEMMSKYENVLDEFKKSVQEYLEDENGEYEISSIKYDEIAEDLINSIDSVFNDISQELELGSAEDKIGRTLSTDFKEKTQIRQLFLDKYFKYNSSSKLLFQKSFRNSAIRSLFIVEDSESKRLANSEEEINESIQNFRNKLIEYIKNALKICSNSGVISDFELALKVNVNLAITNYLDDIFNDDYKFPKSLIARLPEINSDSLNENSKTLLKGFLAYVALKHFDDLMLLTFLKAITIKNYGEYNLDNSNKYSIKTADRVIQQWRDEDVDVDETEELGSLPMLFILSLRIHDKTGKVKDETLEFSNVKVAIGHLMKILDVLPGSDFLGLSFPDTIIGDDITSIIEKEYGFLYNGKEKQSNEVNAFNKRYNRTSGELKTVNYLHWILDTYVKGKTFKQVLASAKRYPEILMPIVFRLTQPIYVNIGDSKIDRNSNYSSIFSKLGKTDETITSLYYEMYSPENYSVFSMNTSEKGFNPDNSSIYLYVNTMFLNIENKLQLEYLKDDEKGIITVNLGDKAGNTRLKLFQRALETKYDKLNPLSQTNSKSEEQFLEFSIIDNLEKEEENESPDGKSITIKIDEKLIIVNSDLTYKVLDENGKGFPVNEQNLRSFTKLFNEVLDLDFNEAFINILKSLGGSLKEVLGLVTKILYHFLVSKHMINTSSNSYDNTIKSYYTINDNNKKLPVVAYSSVQPKIISSFDNKGIMTKLSKVKDILEGYSEINTVQDGERKQVSTLGLSSLLSKYNEIIENYGKDPNSPIKHFSIYGMYEGAELMRDYAEPGNNKQAKKFTEAELVTASFLYDMYGDLMKEDEENEGLLVEKGGGILRVMGPVVSDKGNLIKLKYNWDSPIKEEYNALLRPDDPNAKLRLRDLTTSDLKTIIKEEFGEYYQNVLNYVLSLYGILNKSAIIWAHPGMGKSWSVLNGEYKDLIIDWDVEFNTKRDAWIAKKSNTKIGSKEFDKVKKKYLTDSIKHPEKYLDLIEFYTQEWNRVKNKARLEGKILVASPHILLKLFPLDFDKIITMDDETFIQRNMERGGSEKDSISLKQDLNATLSQIKELDKIVTDNRYLEEILKEGSLRTSYIDMAIDSLGLNYPKGYGFDYLSSFAKFNEIFGKDAHKILREAIYLAQQAGEEIEIIDLVHYTLGKNGELKNNPSLIHQLQVFGKLDGGELYEDFWKRKEDLLFVDFLQTETELQVKEGVNDKKGIAIQTALQKNQGWIKGENIAVAKVSEITLKKEGEETKKDSRSLLIATKDDFQNWYPYKSLVNWYGKELPSELDINSPDANLQAIIEAVDLYSIVRKLSEEEILNKILESKPNKYTNSQEKTLIKKALSLYSKTRLRYNKDIPIEKIELDFLKKINKDFTKDGKLDKKSITDYINKKEIINDIEELINPKKRGKSYLNPFIKSLEKSSYNIELNPEFIKHNLYDFLLSEEFVLSTTGTHVSQPGKSSNISEREAEQFGNAVKRYVAYTASKHREEANALNGITEDINLAIIEDDKDFSFNFVGESGTDKPFDGASFYNIIMNYLDNNSLGGDAMGVDKKPFAHYQGTKSGIGFILKTAGFAHTNDRIRNSKFDARLNKQMNDIKWDSPKVQKLINPNWKSGDPIVTPNWTVDYFGNKINYGEWFAYRQNQDGTWSWYKHRINGDNIEMIKVLSNGEIQNNQKWVKYPNSINSNYDLWEAFGGAYSGHLLKNSDGSETLVYEHDEGSVLKLLKAVNNVGIRKTINGKPIEKVFDLNGVNQYLKKACIHIVATGGAVKYGGANINPKLAYYDDDYHLTHMVIKSYDLGEQLDAEHSAEDGHVSLMTLVVNALGARGYTSLEAMLCYVALSNVAEYITGDILKAMETDDPELIDKVMEKSIYKTLLQASDNDGDMLNALAASLLNGKDPSSKNISEIAKDFPISHPAVFNKILSSLASQLEKGIKLKFEGGMFVLNPSNRRMTVINGHLSGYYDTRRKIYKGKDRLGNDDYVDELIELENESQDHPITSAADIKLGYNYRDSETDELFVINKPTDIYAIKELINQGHTFYETFIDNDNQPLGRDLTTYLLAFSDTEGNRYNSWELDSVRMLQYLLTDKKGNEIGFKIPSRESEEDLISFQTKLQANWDTLTDLLKAFNIFKNKLLLKLKPENSGVNYDLLSLLRVDLQEEIDYISLPEEVQKFGVKNYLTRKFQEDLNAISSGIETEVLIDGRKIKVDKTKIEITPFGLILPPIYKTQFGLKEQDNLSDIEKDKMFFVKRQLKNWKTKISNQNTYDLELKTLNGEHIYLAKLTKDFIPNSRIQQEVSLEFPTNFEWDGEVLYRITPLGKRLYSVPYTVDETGNIIPDIRVFKDKATGTEVIYSKNLTHFLDEFNYNGIVFSQRFPFNKDDFESEEEYKETLYAYKREILKQLDSSNNKTAIRKINNLSKLGSNIINNHLSDELKSDSYDIHFLASTSPDVLINLMDGDYDFVNKNIEQLELDLNSPELTVDDILNRNSFFTGLINSGIEVHTSFLESLEAIVSRTPAQSQLSFMAMKIEAFGLENTNSAYVSRDLLWLQGSDYDIDKISLLGLKFNHGKLVVWSPFFSLKNREEFIASKKLPFPTNKELPMLPVNLESKIPYDVLRNDLTVIDPEDSQFGEMTIITPQGNGLIIKEVPSILSRNKKIVEISATDWENTSELERYILIRRAKEALSKFDGLIMFTNFDIPLNIRQAIGLSGDGYLTGEIDVALDFEAFNYAVLGDYIKYNSVKLIQDNIILYAPNLGILILVYNDLGYIPESQDSVFVKSLVDLHNTSIKNKSLIDSLYNYISIKVKDISADPANRIQGQSPIDPEMDKVKDLINDSEIYPENLKLAGFIKKFDRGSMYSKIKMLTLTLGGKEGVGIEASSLKNFELSSQYNYDILDKGTVEDLEDLLFNVKINGKTYEILANSRARNIDTVKSRRVREVLKRVNLYQDTYLTKSGLLSLSTDNAKDPKLPLLNCGPTMMPLYDAGVMLGMTVNELAHLILTDTGILINKIAQSNIFTGKLEQGRVIDVIRYLLRAPQINLTDSLLSVLKPLFLKLGLLKVTRIDSKTKEKEYEDLNKTKLGAILLNKSLRGQLKEVFRFLLSPSEDYSLLEFKKDRVVNNIISSLYGSKEYKGFSSRAERYFNELEALDKRSESQEKTYQELLEKKNKKAQILEEIKLWENYKNGILPNASRKIKVGNEEIEIGLLINDLDSTINNYNKDDFKSELKRIQGNIFSGRQYLGAIKDIYKWLTYQDIVEETITDENGQNHKVLYQLLKLSEIAEELSVLRPLMKLNLGLANKVEDQIKFYTDFSKIITDRIEVLGKERALKRGNTSELLSKLKQMNDNLRASGVINSKEDYYVDLHTFLYNPEYNKLIKDIYGNIKCTTNIFKVVDYIPNYKKYLRLADGSVNISSKKSKHFRMLRYIEDTVIPEMGAKRSKWLEQMRKNATSYINRQKNKDFLLSQNIRLSIPSFKIENGKLIYLSGKPETILLGLNKENDLKFKLYVEFILFPDLKKKYPNNKFLSYLGYRVFDFNDDHNSSINLSKIKTNNMDNPSDLAQFNLAKLDMLEINKSDISKLFYYNLIAYNNLSGQSSLTIMFDDIIRNNSVDAIVNYNNFITEWDKQPINTLASIEIMKAIAPVLKLYEVNSRIGLKYFYIQNPEDKKTYLCYKISKQGDYEDPNELNQYGPDDGPDNVNAKTFREKIYDAGYDIFGLPKYESKGKEVKMLDFGNKYKYKISLTENFDNILILDGDNWLSANDILKIALNKGISFKDSGEVVKNLTELFGGKSKDIKNKLKEILYKLDIILHDDSVNQC